MNLIRFAIILCTTFPAYLSAATLIVNNATDEVVENECNLRQAMTSVEIGFAIVGCENISPNPLGVEDTIYFDFSTSNPIISLSSELPAIDYYLIIDGVVNGDEKVTIDIGGDDSDPRRAVSLLANAEGFIRNLIFRNGYVNAGYTGNASETGVGGAIFLQQADLVIENCEFFDNFAALEGGALKSLGGPDGNPDADVTHLDIIGSKFQGNTSLAGGAIDVDGVHPGYLMQNNVFNNNVASSGGAIKMLGMVEFTIKNCLFDGNLANGNINGNGGAIYYDSAQMNPPSLFHQLVIGSTFANNESNDTGGAVFSKDMPTTYINNTFYNNKAANNGNTLGGGDCRASNATMCTTNLYHNTFLDNELMAVLISDVIQDLQGNGGPDLVHYKNNVIGKSGSQASSYSYFSGGGIINQGGNWIQNDSMNGQGFSQSLGFGVENYPGMEVIADNGGSTPTSFPKSDADGMGSPSVVIDAGMCLSQTDIDRIPVDRQTHINLNIDQRGLPRLSGIACDAGSVEVTSDIIFVNGFESIIF